MLQQLTNAQVERLLMLREAAYAARRILRANCPKTTRRKIARHASADYMAAVDKLCDILPPLLATECVAAAEAKAIEIYKEQNP